MRPLAFLLYRTGRLAAVLLIFLAVWLGGFVWFVGSSFWGRIDRTSPTDAIVVLTGGKMRLETGIALLAAGKATKLFVSGVNPAVDRDTLLRALGPAAKREACCIVLGHAAGNTVGNAVETALWMQQEGYRSLRLVTSWYHMHRSLLEFRRAMPMVRVIAHPVFARDSGPEGWRGWLASGHLVFAEYNKFLAAWLRCLISGRARIPAAPVVRTAVPATKEAAWTRRL